MILLSAGGTGGHIFPAAALAEDLKSRGFDVALATDLRALKYKDSFVGVDVHVLKSSAWSGGLLSKIKGAFSMALGYVQAKKLIADLKPEVVIGFGGYPSVPAVLAAQRQKIPTIIHEQNAILGKANVFLAPRAERIALSHEDSIGLDKDDKLRAVVTGNPVRKGVADLFTEPYPDIQPDGAFNIFVMGGSLGATVLSKVVPDALAALPEQYRKRINVVQQCREEDRESLKEKYKAAEIGADVSVFFNNVSEQLQKAHLIIARAGASTVSEVSTAGRPAIYVPYPHHADQQQKINAEAVANKGGAWVMVESGFTADALGARLETFLQNPQALFKAAEAAQSCAKPDAGRRLGNLVVALARGWD
ncbi:MAG: undecaprenyldiphospho-muramoylpentapeptide beta-N-acetylglucosaminyltransferase [Pseudomonadota bacterium]|jgi:UDP-N-acetylglucosamine--N-acetylmuramyl-(pentapeptide) pyrophosphoryl-undecaprenol N-acetylglucosamine transferase|nr:undecaprenyldiphospho-muramoylpentapeptide beta-N-acetylglucosaminyltransferase [Pseudomonadota bacterium]MEC9235570.1 undecaprenyldiphospho-muramoylpentapeptide beta-N-acetylglucosaminyltransferase [Pseudomonadota bacterium]MED5423728.1 undecaprenyldiphospho-muramoylpentapeptide beta-N-acetylglucosaminyltransferase [Pseudomonadota bacterium]MEE3322521.1 undecaprenyldiphospho-muramoylpentapeptide beta-N-acetylglucosaminyltransferase [Pseudomonadota bacterium]